MPLRLRSWRLCSRRRWASRICTTQAEAVPNPACSRRDLSARAGDWPLKRRSGANWSIPAESRPDESTIRRGEVDGKLTPYRAAERATCSRSHRHYCRTRTTLQTHYFDLLDTSSDRKLAASDDRAKFRASSVHYQWQRWRW